MILKNISYSLTALVLSKPLGFLLSLILARSLGPVTFGVWVTLMLVVSYGPIVCLGTVETLLKRLPYYLGRGETRQIRVVEDSVLATIVISAAIVISFALAMFPMFPATVLGVPRALITMMLLASAASYFSGYFINRFAAYEDFKSVAILDFVRSVLALFFVGTGGWLWGLSGAVGGYLLHELSVCSLGAVLNVRSHGRIGLDFTRCLLISAVKIGFPITLLWWVLTLTGTVDRVVLGSLLGPRAVGYYGLGIALTSILVLVPTAVGRVLYPKVNKQFGSKGGAEEMKRVVLGPTLILGALLVNLQLILLIVMPFFYNQLLPKYQPGLLAGEVLIMGSFFHCLLRNGANYLIATDKERIFLTYIAMTLVFNVAADVSLVKAGLGIVGVAIGTSAAGLFLSSLVWRQVFLGLGCRYGDVWRAVVKLYLPIILLTLTAVCARFIYPSSFRSFGPASLAAGVLVLIALNGLLCCFATYREEIRRMSERLANGRILFAKRPTLAENAIQP